MFGLPYIRLVRLLFLAGTVFSLTTIQPEQCFSASFSEVSAKQLDCQERNNTKTQGGRKKPRSQHQITQKQTMRTKEKGKAKAKPLEEGEDNHQKQGTKVNLLHPRN